MFSKCDCGREPTAMVKKQRDAMQCKLEAHSIGGAHAPPPKLFSWLAVNETILNHASLQRRAPNTWDFPDVIKFRVAAHMISEKAIRLWHPDYNPDRAQKLISSSMSRICRHATFHRNPCTRFSIILLTETDRQINESE